MRIVITGASGNVGSAVVRRLAGRGEHDLVGLVRRPPHPGDSASWSESSSGVEWTSVDLTRDDVALAEAMRGADAVVHLAWGFQPSHLSLIHI